MRTVEDVDLTSMGFNSPSYIDLLTRVTNRAFAEGFSILADPAFSSVAVELNRCLLAGVVVSPMAETRVLYWVGGDDRIRTGDPLRAKQVLSH